MSPVPRAPFIRCSGGCAWHAVALAKAGQPQFVAAVSDRRKSCHRQYYANKLRGHAGVLRIRGYRFFFFSREGHEARHIHVEQAERYAKFWLKPIELVETRGFRGSELRELYSLIEEHRDKFIIAWDEHFGQ